MQPTITITSPAAGTFEQFIDDGSGNQYDVTFALTPISGAAIQAQIAALQAQASAAATLAQSSFDDQIAALQSKLAAYQAAIPDPSQPQS